MNKIIDYVNTKIGTNNEKRFSEGNIYPIVGLPNGLASFTIQTYTLDGFNKRWFYQPQSKSFEGIRLTHQPSPWVGDYGHMLMMPFDDGFVVDNPDTYFSTYNVDKAILKPDLMRVHLFKYNADLQLVPTFSGARLDIKFGNNKPHGLLIKMYEDKYEWVHDKSSNIIHGKFVAVDHEVPFELWTYIQIRPNKPCTFEKLDGNVFAIKFSDHEISFDIATSFISDEQVSLNLNRELNVSFEEIHKLAEESWEEKLSKILIETKDQRITEMFYTSMYRTFLFPRKFYELDHNNKPYHIHLETGMVVPGKMYVDNGFWDTYKTVYPLLAIIDRPLYKDILEGIYQYYLDTKKLPKWLSPNELGYMPGYLIYAVIADAVIKEIVDVDFARKLYDAATDFESNYKHFEVFKKQGYFSNDSKESVNETLDVSYMYDCLAQMAKKLNDHRYETFKKLSLNYKNLFDKETRFMRPKDKDGLFISDFNPIRWGGPYTEGSAWQTSFGVYHDLEGLNELCNNQLLDKIDEMFNTEAHFDIGFYGIEIHEMSEMAYQNFGQCAISNQPSFHIPYIYAYFNQKNKTYEIVSRMIEEAFLNRKYPGDEDNGSMAGWFIFSVLGFYPMTPGRKSYTLSYPIVDKFTLNQKVFTKNDLLINSKTEIDIEELL